MPDVSEHEDFPLFLDHSRPLFISAFGRKGSGKSAFNRAIYHSYPGDKLAIDVNGNADPGEDAETITTADLAKQWPAPATVPGERRKTRNLHYLADPGSATYEDDLDRAVGMALLPKHHPVMLWSGECQDLMPNGRGGPAMRRLLAQNRHYSMTVLFDSPRPMWINRLVLTQSNLIALFELPEPDDRKRVAQATGHNAKRFDEICQETWERGEYWYLLINMDARRGERLWRCAPLPIEAAAGQPAR
jgi:hypothetical protein